MRANTAATIMLAAVAKGSAMMQALNIIAPLTLVAVVGAALYLLQSWRRGRQPQARPEEDSGGWTRE